MSTLFITKDPKLLISHELLKIVLGTLAHLSSFIPQNKDTQRPYKTLLLRSLSNKMEDHEVPKSIELDV